MVIGWIPGKVLCCANGKNVVNVTFDSFQAILKNEDPHN